MDVKADIEPDLRNEVLQIKTAEEFSDLALKIFRYRSKHVSVYRKYLELKKINPTSVKAPEEIPFLPISFFKTHKISGSDTDHEVVFTSSGTTGEEAGRHYVRDVSWYKTVSRICFEYFFGDISQYRFLALLPSYLEREGSSLVYMMNDFIEQTKQNGSGFFLHNTEELANTIRERSQKSEVRSQKIKTILFGVTYALIDFAEKYPMDLSGVIIMETGGMKGKRKEMVREEVHSLMKKKFSAEKIYSEYGMTELMSQAYSKGDGIFQCPPWMKIFIRDVNDPLQLLPAGKTGGINIIDLANLHSCAFIATDDLGKKHNDGSFEILGRYDASDLRGCNLLME